MPMASATRLPGKQRGFEQDAGELGAVGQHVVRPFQFEAVAPARLSAAVGGNGDAPVGHDRVERVGQRQSGDEAERRGMLQVAVLDQKQRRGEIALGRRPDAAAPAAAAFLPLRNDPQPAGIAGGARSSASALVEPTLSCASSR